MRSGQAKLSHHEPFDLQVRLLSLAAQRLWSPAAEQLPVALHDTSWTQVHEQSSVLQLLGAIDDNGLTEVGDQMEPFVTNERFPISPRLAKVVLQSAKMGCTRAAINIASFLATDRPLHLCPTDDRVGAWVARGRFSKFEDREDATSDFPALLEADRQLQAAARGGTDALDKFCKSHFLSRLTFYRAHDIRRHLLQLARHLRMPLEQQEVPEEVLVEAFLYGFGDRLLRADLGWDYGDDKWVWAIGHNGGPGLTYGSAITDAARHRGRLAVGVSLLVDNEHYCGQFDVAARCTPEQVAKVFSDRVTVRHCGYYVSKEGKVCCEEQWRFGGENFLHRYVNAPGGAESGQALLLAMRDSKVQLPSEVLPLIDQAREASRLSGGTVPAITDLQVIELLAPHVNGCTSIAEVLAKVGGVKLTWADLTVATGCSDLEARVADVRVQFPLTANFGGHEVPVTYANDRSISIEVKGDGLVVVVLPHLHEAALPSALSTLAATRAIQLVVTFDDGGQLDCAFKDEALMALRRQAACRKHTTDKIQQPMADGVRRLLVEVLVDHGTSKEIVFVCRSHHEVFDYRPTAVAQAVGMVRSHLSALGTAAAVAVCPVHSQPDQQEVSTIVLEATTGFPDGELPKGDMVVAAEEAVWSQCEALVRERLAQQARLLERIRVLRSRATLSDQRQWLGKLGTAERQLGGGEGTPAPVPAAGVLVQVEEVLGEVEGGLPEALPDDHPKTRLEVQIYELGQLANQAFGNRKGEAKQAIGRLNALLRTDQFEAGLALVPTIRREVEAAVAASAKKK